MERSGYLIEKYNDMGNAYTCRRLLSEAAAVGLKLCMVGVNDTYFLNGALCNGGRRLEPRDFALIRYKTGQIKDGINALCGRSYNPLPAFNSHINKLFQLTHLSSDAFRKPHYLAMTGSADFGFVADRLGLPFVAKGLESSMGQEIFLVKDRKDFAAVLSRFSPEKEWLFEEYISASTGRDIRLFSIRGRAAAAMERRSESDFRANVALGSSVRPLDITPAFSRIAEDIYRQTCLDVLGIDLLYGEDEPYFCEINVMPGLEGIEKASGLNIAGEILQMIKGDLDDDERRS